MKALYYLPEIQRPLCDIFKTTSAVVWKIKSAGYGTANDTWAVGWYMDGLTERSFHGRLV